MAARKKAKREARPAPTFPDPGVERVPVSNAARLATVDEDGVRSDDGAVLSAADCKGGTFVRVLPTAAATDEQLGTVKAQWTEWGAAAVRVMPRAQADELRVEKQAVTITALPPTRKLVLELVDKSTSRRKKELRELVNELADAEGL